MVDEKGRAYEFGWFNYLKVENNMKNSSNTNINITNNRVQ
jgi:hypothetical protein